MRALAALLLLAAVTLAIPVPVLSVTDGTIHAVVKLDDGERYTYSYVNSIYEAPVEERHVRLGDGLSITSVGSPDRRAVEYFRWEGEPLRVGDAYEQRAPANTTLALTIRVSPAYAQRLAGGSWSIDLAGTFGDGVVHVSPERQPAAIAFWRGWRP